MNRRQLLQGAVSTALLTAMPVLAQSKPLVEVWKAPTCGCCKDWMKHLEDNGFTTRGIDTGNTSQRRRLNVPEQLGSCHTALVGGYAIEGHVPARDIQRLLREKPKAVGLAVPGMPLGAGRVKRIRRAH